MSAPSRWRRWRPTSCAFLLAIACAASFGSGCAGAGRGEVAGPKDATAPPLRVGMTGATPPFSSEQEGTMIGLEPDLARELATELSRGLTFHEYDFEELIPALRDGEIDVIMSGMTATPLRALRIGFTHSYLSIGQRLLVRARDAEVYASAELVRTAGARIGVLKSTTGEQYARARLAPAPVRTYGNLTDAADDLAAGSLDVVVSDAPIVSALASSREPGTLVVVGELLTHESLAWGVRKEDVELRHQLDAALERMRADGRLASIANRWLPAMH